jgi:hypothetical protein
VSVDADGVVGFAVVAADPRPRPRPPRTPVAAGIFLRLLLDSRLAATGTWDSSASASSMTYSRRREEGQGIRQDETREGGLPVACWQRRRAAYLLAGTDGGRRPLGNRPECRISGDGRQGTGWISGGRARTVEQSLTSVAAVLQLGEQQHVALRPCRSPGEREN